MQSVFTLFIKTIKKRRKQQQRQKKSKCVIFSFPDLQGAENRRVHVCKCLACVRVHCVCVVTQAQSCCFFSEGMWVTVEAALGRIALPHFTGRRSGADKPTPTPPGPEGAEEQDKIRFPNATAECGGVGGGL